MNGFEWYITFVPYSYFYIEKGKNMCGLAACSSYPVPLWITEIYHIKSIHVQKPAPSLMKLNSLQKINDKSLNSDSFKRFNDSS